MIKIQFNLFSKEEALLGFRVNTYNFCDGKDEQDQLIINEYLNLSLGILFCSANLSIKRGRLTHIKF